VRRFLPVRRRRVRSDTGLPILLLSFNRPHYLKEVLLALAAQPGLGPGRVHLFQDGAVNAYSGRVAAQQADVDACIALFRQHFPGGRVYAAPANVGIAENFLRAERFAFEELGAECAYFFEDDLVPAPTYLTVMDRLHEAIRHEDRIAYFAAYGDHTASLARQRAAPKALITLGHHWAFGLKRSHWQMMQPLLAPYYALVIGRDYAARSSQAVRAALRRDGLAPAHSSQDNVKAFVTTCLRRARINTVACFGRYVGETGMNFTPERFTAMGFGKTHLFDRRPPRAFATPSTDEIEGSISAMAEIFADSYRRTADPPAPHA
jgi:hypothetical protein